MTGLPKKQLKKKLKTSGQPDKPIQGIRIVWYACNFLPKILANNWQEHQFYDNKLLKTW